MEYIEAMKYEAFYQCWLAITMIEAQEFLVNIRVIDYPNCSDRDRKKIHREMIKTAYFTKEERTVKVDDLQNMFGMSDISQVLKAKKKGKNVK